MKILKYTKKNRRQWQWKDIKNMYKLRRNKFTNSMSRSLWKDMLCARFLCSHCSGKSEHLESLKNRRVRFATLDFDIVFKSNISFFYIFLFCNSILNILKFLFDFLFIVSVMSQIDLFQTSAFLLNSKWFLPQKRFILFKISLQMVFCGLVYLLKFVIDFLKMIRMSKMSWKLYLTWHKI